jgi:hypothetical protein
MVRTPCLALSIQQSAFRPEIFIAKDAKVAKKKGRIFYIPLRTLRPLRFVLWLIAEC